MLRIRFQRIGKLKQPLYRIIVSDRIHDTQFRNTEILGTYNPRSKDLVLEKERLDHWMKVGAQPSNTINNLLVSKGLIQGKKQKSVALSNKRKAKIAAKAAAAK